MHTMATEQYFPVVLLDFQLRLSSALNSSSKTECHQRGNAFQHNTSHQYQPLSFSLAAHAMASSLLVPTFPDLPPHPGPYQHLLTPSALLNPKNEKIRQKFIIYFLEVGSLVSGCLYRFI